MGDEGGLVWMLAIAAIVLSLASYIHPVGPAVIIMAVGVWALCT